MRREGRSTDIIRASQRILLTHVKYIVKDPKSLSHVNTREDLINPSPKNPVEGFIKDNIFIRRRGLSNVPFLRALDKIQSNEYMDAIKILIQEADEYTSYNLIHLIEHVLKDIINIIEAMM